LLIVPPFAVIGSTARCCWLCRPDLHHLRRVDHLCCSVDPSATSTNLFTVI